MVELGGSDAYAILADCDLDLAAEAVVNARVANSGQTCIAPKRAIVEKTVKARSVDGRFFELFWAVFCCKAFGEFGEFGLHIIFSHSSVHLRESRFEAAFEQKILEKISQKKYGVDFGPLVHPVGRDQVAKQVLETQSQGAKLLYGGPDVKVPTSDCGKSGPQAGRLQSSQNCKQECDDTTNQNSPRIPKFSKKIIIFCVSLQ